MVTVEGSSHGSPIDNKVKSGDKGQNEDGGDEVTPDVDALVVDHEKTANDPPGSVEVDPVPVSDCLLYTSPSPRDQRGSRMPSSA